MFEKAIDMIQKQLPAGDHPSWIAPVIVLFVAWVIFMMIRESGCWFWKTTKIANELERINSNMDALKRIAESAMKENAALKAAGEKKAPV